MKQINHSSLKFIGDTHGYHGFVNDQCSVTTDTLFIHVGDVGLGFDPINYDEITLNALNKTCKDLNNTVILIRGNHDNKKVFDHFRGKFSNVYIPEEYEVVKFRDKTIQFIGGAVSIDRRARHAGIDYWPDEGVVQDIDKCQKVDILVTHTAPSKCTPVGLSPFVLGWCKHDFELKHELISEREYMDKVIEICQPELHCYGHFHLTSIQSNLYSFDCTHVVLDINHVWDAKKFI